MSLAALLAGCAQVPHGAPPVAPAANEAVPLPGRPVPARIVAIRPLPAPSPVAGPVLRVIAPLPASPAAATRALEIVLRTDDGRTVSVVQGDVGALKPGDRVLLEGEQRVHLADPAVAKPGAT